VSPSTGTVYRALFGLPLLVLVGVAEWRRYGAMPAMAVRLAAIAGLFFAGDLLLWHHAIEYVGAGLASSSSASSRGCCSESALREPRCSRYRSCSSVWS
jgi:drug/metabolite transporter (DMT)-like permease